MNRSTALSVVLTAFAVLALTLSFALPGQGQGGPPGGRDVRVINAPAEPVPVRETSHPALQPWHQALDLNMADGETSVQLLLNIPAGKRLVLEHVTAGLTVLTNQTPLVFFWGSNPSAQTVPHTIHVENVGPWANENQRRWSGSHPMKVYLDNALVRVARVGGTSGPLFATISFSGTLVDAP